MYANIREYMKYISKHVNLINNEHPNKNGLSTVISLLNPDVLFLARDLSNYIEKSLDIRKNDM